MSAADLDELLTRAKAGDEEAFAEIVLRFERTVRGLILRVTQDAALSEDLAQEVFLRLWGVLPAFTTAAGLPNWIKKVAINAVISHWRHQESQRRRLEAMIEAFPPKEAQGPAAILIEEEDRSHVRAALELMPADLRSVLTLRVYENMSYDELADALGLEVGTVRSRLFRARQMMKSILERWEHARRRARHV